MICLAMFHSRYTVDFVDTDAGGVVYHTRYLEMAERARAAMLRHIGLSNKQLLQVNMIFPVTNLTCRFHKPAKLDDTIDTVSYTHLTLPTKA
jgi:YbgC/YbaW family acyl-CoA thioester hydrolase